MHNFLLLFRELSLSLSLSLTLSFVVFLLFLFIFFSVYIYVQFDMHSVFVLLLFVHMFISIVMMRYVLNPIHTQMNQSQSFFFFLHKEACFSREKDTFEMRILHSRSTLVCLNEKMGQILHIFRHSISFCMKWKTKTIQSNSFSEIVREWYGFVSVGFSSIFNVRFVHTIIYRSCRRRRRRRFRHWHANTTDNLEIP